MGEAINYYDELGKLLVFVAGGASFILVTLFVAKLIRPSRPNPEKLTTYESGEDPVSSARPMFNNRFYIIAIVFLLFEVELVFLFPWVTVYDDDKLILQTNGLWKWYSFFEMMTFVGVLAVGLAYAWAKGLLEWVKPHQELPEFKSPVPEEQYKNINRKYQSGNESAG